jgi:hypothetical protein
MSGLDLVAIQDSITAHVRQEFSGYEVYEDYVMDDETILKESNKVKPYIVLSWDGLRNSPTGGSFVSSRFDEYYSVVDVSVVAPTARQARISSNVIVDKLIGWNPTGSTPMAPEGSTGIWAVENNNGKPHLYVASARLRFNVNSENVGSYITP